MSAVADPGAPPLIPAGHAPYGVPVHGGPAGERTGQAGGPVTVRWRGHRNDVAVRAVTEASRPTPGRRETGRRGVGRTDYLLLRTQVSMPLQTFDVHAAIRSPLP